MATLFGMCRFPLWLYADRGYQGPLFRAVVRKIMARVHGQIVKRSDALRASWSCQGGGFLERAFAWLGRWRRQAGDWECLNRKGLTFLLSASIRIMVSLRRGPPRLLLRGSYKCPLVLEVDIIAHVDRRTSSHKAAQTQTPVLDARGEASHR